MLIQDRRKILDGLHRSQHADASATQFETIACKTTGGFHGHIEITIFK
jgi:hypothetical protein